MAADGYLSCGGEICKRKTFRDGLGRFWSSGEKWDAAHLATTAQELQASRDFLASTAIAPLPPGYLNCKHGTPCRRQLLQLWLRATKL